MEIRELVEKDYLESLRLSMYAFQYKVVEEKIPSRLESLKGHKVLGVWEQNCLAAKLHIFPLHIFMNGDKWKMGGIAGVATYPEFRRNGYVKLLITESLKRMREDQQIVSLLAPFDFSFYRKFGWEILSDKKKVTIDKGQLKFLEEQQGSVKRFTKETHHRDIERVYEKYCQLFTGTLVRETKWWLENVYDEDTQIAVYYSTSNDPLGYILYNVKDRKMHIQETAVLTHEARAGLWNFICQHDSMIESLTINLSLSDPLSYLLAHPKIKTELYSYFMARIVEAEECLKRFPFTSLNESLFLHIDDSFAPWNNGSYLISQDGIKVFKEKPGSHCSHPPQKGIQLTINALSAILFGYKRPRELYDLGLLQGSEKEIHIFEKMVPSLTSAFFDFF
jgi:predicted acetyltransferase